MASFSAAPPSPVEAVDQQTLDEFERWLEADLKCQALSSNKRARLRMVLQPDYTVPRQDITNTNKSKTELAKEISLVWRERDNFTLNDDDQVMRKAEKTLGERIAACTYDAHRYIMDTHRDLGHAGIGKTFESLQQRVYSIRRIDVHYLVSRCAVCQFQRPTNTKAPLQPIIVERVLERIQIDLIDFRTSSDGQYKWVCQIKDHFSKFTALYALKSKRASEIADCLANFLMFCGPPEIAQMDNGKEFKGICLILLKRFGIHVVYGRPRHPQAQGLVEQANGVAKVKLGAYLKEMGIAKNKWAAVLPVIAMQMNQQPHSSLPKGITPYQVMFNRRIINLKRPPHSDRMEACQISDALIDRVCSSDEPETDPIVKRLLARVPEEEFTEDEDEDTSDADEAEAAVIKQVKKMSLQPANANIDPQLFFVSYRFLTILTTFDSPSSQPEATSVIVGPELPPLLHQRSQPPPPEIHTSQGPSEEMTALASASASASAPNESNLQIRYEATTGLAQNIEKKTRQHQAHVRESMKKKHDGKHNVMIFKEGDFATVAITGNDRMSLDPRRMLVKIYKVVKNNTYQLQCKHGMINRKYRASSLNTVPEDIVRRYREEFIHAPIKEITLHAASILDSNIDRITVLCNCKGSCTTKRCRCKKNDKECGQNCHGDNINCGNMAERIVDRIDKPIVYVNTNSEPATTHRRKRAATNTSPKQRRHKQPKKKSPPSNTLSAIDSLNGEPLRRPSRRQKPTFKVREKQRQEEDEEDEEDEENKEDGSRVQQQLTLYNLGRPKRWLDD